MKPLCSTGVATGPLPPNDNDRINTSGDTRPRRTLRAEAAANAMLARLSTHIT